MYVLGIFSALVSPKYLVVGKPATSPPKWALKAAGETKEGIKERCPAFPSRPVRSRPVPSPGHARHSKQHQAPVKNRAGGP